MTIQDALQEILDQAVDSGAERSIQVAAYLEGELVVDAQASSTAFANKHSLYPFFSTGKGIAATAIHRLVERGVVSWDEPIARVWPEFAAKGKGQITLRHALNHTAGLPMMPEQCASLATDWAAMCDYLANAEPLHPPGEQRHYHAVTFSWLIGETARRADGRDFGRIIQEEVCRPLGIGDLFVGVPDDALDRCIDAEEALPGDTPAPSAPDVPAAWQAIPSWVYPLEDWINRTDVRQACIPASNGYGTAHALARHYAALVGNGVDGVRLLTGKTLAAATRLDPEPGPGESGAPCWGLGYQLRGDEKDPGVIFGHGGYGGSIGLADRRYGLAIAVVKSRMGGTIRDQVIEAIRGECIPSAGVHTGQLN